MERGGDASRPTPPPVDARWARMPVPLTARMLTAAADLRDVACVPAILAAILFVVGNCAATSRMRAFILVSLVRHIKNPSFLKKRV